VRDLELENTLAALTSSRLGRSSIREVFLTLCTDPAVIAYRQDILDDLWRNPDFTAHLEALMPDLSALEASPPSTDRRRSPLQEVAWRLGELEHLVSCVTGLSSIFAQVGDKVRAAGWCTLRDYIAQTTQDAVYQHLTRALPEMLRTVRAKVSVTIGVNLDSQLRPVAATLLAVHDQKFTASTFLDRLFGRRGEDFTGLGPLHTVPNLAQGRGLSASQGGNRDLNPLMVPLFRDLAQVLDTVCQAGVTAACGKSRSTHNRRARFILMSADASGCVKTRATLRKSLINFRKSLKNDLTMFVFPSFHTACHVGGYRVSAIFRHTV